MLWVAECNVEPAESPCTTSALPQTINTIALRTGKAVNGSNVVFNSSTRRFGQAPTPSGRSAEADWRWPRLRPAGRAGARGGVVLGAPHGIGFRSGTRPPPPCTCNSRTQNPPGTHV